MEKAEDNGAAQNTGTGMAYFYQVTNVIENIIFAVAELFWIIKSIIFPYILNVPTKFGHPGIIKQQQKEQL